MKTIDEVLAALQVYYEEQAPYFSGSQGEGFLSAIGVVARMKAEDAK